MEVVCMCVSLLQGTAEARTRGAVVMKYGKGDYFGELALLNDEPRSATVLALTDCKVVSINSESFKVCSCKCHTGCKGRLR
jgi:cAMP-dependent protein kinase regulator